MSEQVGVRRWRLQCNRERLGSPDASDERPYETPVGLHIEKLDSHRLKIGFVYIDGAEEVGETRELDHRAKDGVRQEHKSAVKTFLGRHTYRLLRVDIADWSPDAAIEINRPMIQQMLSPALNELEADPNVDTENIAGVRRVLDQLYPVIPLGSKRIESKNVAAGH